MTFALLVQFGSFLADVDRTRTGPARLYLYTRRLAEVVVDGALIAASFLAAYLRGSTASARRTSATTSW